MKLRMGLIFTTIIFRALLIDIPAVKSLSNSDLLLREGIAKKIAGNQNEAIKIFDAALQQNPNLVAAYVGRGDVKQQAEQYQSAISDFNRAIELNPSGRDIYWARANAKLQVKQTNAMSALSYKYSALVDYQQALELTQKEGDLKREQILIAQIDYIQNHFKEIAVLIIIAFMLCIAIYYGVRKIYKLHHIKMKKQL